MTTQELFIGHFEGALTPDESLHLETILAGSAELRTQFDQHQQIHSMMLREAEETKPSEALDDATIGAALGLLGQTIGGGSVAFWTGTKIAATIGSVVVGGAVTWFAVTQNPEPQAPAGNQPTPTVQIAPAPQVQEPTVAPVVVDEGASSSSAEKATPTGSSKEASTTRSKGETEGKDKQFNLGQEKPIEVNQGTRINPPQRK